MSFAEAIAFLYSLEKLGIKMDLDNIRTLMQFAGNPHERLKVIHVAGTNGKGSTSALIASVMTSAGFKTGLYTSPHITSFTERIKIDGVEIGEKDIERLSEFFRPEVERIRATYFEATTAMMFKYFDDSGVDYAVLETGMGGRLDATNIVDPIVSIITSIGLDHTEILGDTPEKIAFEKAGIVKPGKPAVVNVLDKSVKEVFTRAATERSCPLYFVHDVANYSNLIWDLANVVMDAEVFGQKFDKLRVGLAGRHQAENALTALSTLKLMIRMGLPVDRSAIFNGMSSVGERTGHRGRLEVISRNPLVIVDVANNPDGVSAVLDALSPVSHLKGILLFAAMRDKDSTSMLNHLRERFSRVILTQLQVGRSLSVAELKKLTESIKLESQVFENSAEALRAALNQTDDDNFLLITGSHYLAGEVIPVMEKATLGIESL